MKVWWAYRYRAYSNWVLLCQRKWHMFLSRNHRQFLGSLSSIFNYHCQWQYLRPFKRPTLTRSSPSPAWCWSLCRCKRGRHSWRRDFHCRIMLRVRARTIQAKKVRKRKRVMNVWLRSNSQNCRERWVCRFVSKICSKWKQRWENREGKKKQINSISKSCWNHLNPTTNSKPKTWTI